jgi:phage terminase small subunit
MPSRSRGTLDAMTAKNTLTPKQAAFVEAYVTNGHNASKAYRDAGYATTSDVAVRVGAHKLVTNPNVSQVITRQLAAKQERASVDQDRLVGYALAVYHRAIELDKLADANASVVTLGRLTGLLQDKRTVTVNHDRDAVREELARLFTFEELLAMRNQVALPEATVDVVDADVTDITDE